MRSKNRYKNFKDIKVGDILYVVEISNVDVHFRIIKVREIDTEIHGTKEKPWFYFDDSPLSYTTIIPYKSNWCNLIFTDKIEALKSARKQIAQRLKYFGNQIILYSNYLEEIENNNIEFEDKNIN